MIAKTNSPALRSPGSHREQNADVLRRLAGVESMCATNQKTLDIQFQRMAAMQAQIDLLIARPHN